MSFEAVLVLIVILLLLAALYLELAQPALIFLVAVLIFYFFGILSLPEILSGLGNDNIILIFLLIVISDIIKKTGVMDSLVNRVLKPGLSLKAFNFRMTGVVSLISGFINNTPLVAIMIPYVYDWAKKNRISPSKVMLPLSFAAIIGGTLTLIGTSTNLIVNGLNIEAGQPSLKMFDFIYVGLPAIVIGVLYITFFFNKALPDRKDMLVEYKEFSRDYLVETIVPQKSNLIGKSIEKGNLRNLKGLYLVQIIRGNELIAPVSPKEIIFENDRLFFAGDTMTIIDLMEGNKNLSLPYGHSMMQENENNILEVIITGSSRLINQTPKTSNFRKKYDAAIIAIQRNGEKLSGKLGEIKLKFGDLLLLIAGKNFYRYSENEQDFLITSRIKEIQSIPKWQKTFFFICLITFFLLAATEKLPLFIGLLILIGITALIKMVKFPSLKNAIDLNLLFILVLALAVGKAISNSGIAQISSNFFINLFGHNIISVLVILYITTNVITHFITNAAAVAITFPLAFAAHASFPDISFTPFVLTIAYAASAAFLTPFGYQTNLMVYGPGNYQFRDYIKFGLPLAIIYFILTIGILGYKYQLF